MGWRFTMDFVLCHWEQVQRSVAFALHFVGRNCGND